jgi:hypothetical protein
MTRKRRHAVILIQRPADWTPTSPMAFPPAGMLLQDRLALSQAAEVARLFNAYELKNPTGRWAIAAKDLRPHKPKGGAR